MQIYASLSEENAAIADVFKNLLKEGDEFEHDVDRLDKEDAITPEDRLMFQRAISRLREAQMARE